MKTLLMNNRRIQPLSFLLVAAAVLTTNYCSAQEPEDPVLATIADESIRLSQVEWEFQKSFGNREVGEQLQLELKKKILDRLVGQHLILQSFNDSEILANEDEIKLEVAKLEERLTQTEQQLDDFLKQQSQTLETLKFNFRWQISWKRYLDKTLSDEVMERYFERYHERFDGSQVRVSHLLLKTSETMTVDQVAAVQTKAQSIFEAIQSGTEWKAAVTEHSQAPSAKNGGAIGWIGFDGPMPRTFTDQAFATEVDSVSEPIRTKFGFHLIRCDEKKRGTIQWYDAKKQIQQEAAEELFRRLVTRQEPKSDVQRFNERLDKAKPKE